MNIFTRSLGEAAGIQLNPLVDRSYETLPSTIPGDQTFAIMMESKRGRIDRPFLVTRENVYRKLGKPGTIRENINNEAWVHVVEALNNGAAGAVIQRMTSFIANETPPVPADDKRDWILCYYKNTDGNGIDVTDKTDILFKTVTHLNKNSLGLAGNYLTGTPKSINIFFIRLLECFSDGVKISIHADDNGFAENKKLTIRVIDSESQILYEFYGSLNQDAKDENGNSIYLGDVIASQTDDIEFCSGLKDPLDSTTTTGIYKESSAFGYSATHYLNWATSALLLPYTEALPTQTVVDVSCGGTLNGRTVINDTTIGDVYIGKYSATSIYTNARKLLNDCNYKFSYVSTGGSLVPELIQQSALLAYYRNAQLRYDIPAECKDGTLSVANVIKFRNTINFGDTFSALGLNYADNASHLVQAFWAPISSRDPTGININGFFGVATLHIAYSCGRNAQRNAKGFAPKNFVTSGYNWPINRGNIKQHFFPNDQDIDNLARNQINPVLFQSFSDKGAYVFTDSLTSTNNSVSLRKLISVVEMSTSIDDAVISYGKQILQLPMHIALKRMNEFLMNLFSDAEAAGWLVKSNDPEMKGKSHRFTVSVNAIRPYDAMDVSYWLRYDGTLRQIFVTQTLTR